MKKTISITVGAVLLSASMASAALITMPDMSGGGTYTLAAGDSWVNTANTVVGGEYNTSVINIYGDWTSAEAFEVALGGVNARDTTDFTLNIFSTGSVDISKHWMAMTTVDGSAITSRINIDTGGSFGRATSDGQFTRYRWPGNDWNNSIERLWDEDALSRDGLTKSDLLAAGEDEAFTSNFDVVGDASWNTTYTMTAIPEPATLGLVAVFGGGVLFIRRRFMI